ncbi:MAG: hypothetical protein NC177_18340 [Ruminococcus flavefaciens]|nr:hypothetical protein [Ruminococcus flavefaciens]
MENEIFLNIYETILKISSAVAFVPSTVIQILCSLSAILVIFFSTRYRNGEHKPLYYIIALFFPLIVLIVFAVKRKEMNGVGMKVCPSCHRKYPKEFVTCYQCNIELPPYNAKKQNSQKVAAIIMSVVFALSFAFTALQTGLAVAETMLYPFTGLMEDNDCYEDYEDYEADGALSQRKGFKDENGETCYYDMKGNAYSDPDEVALYTKDGVKYVYSNATENYRGTDGKSVDLFSAYVDENGFFVEVDCERLTFDKGGWTDANGNKYYDANFVSWDKDGKLIENWY